MGKSHDIKSLSALSEIVFNVMEYTFNAFYHLFFPFITNVLIFCFLTLFAYVSTQIVLFEKAEFGGKSYEIYRDVADATSLQLSPLISVNVIRGW